MVVITGLVLACPVIHAFCAPIGVGTDAPTARQRPGSQQSELQPSAGTVVATMVPVIPVYCSNRAKEPISELSTILLQPPLSGSNKLLCK